MKKEMKEVSLGYGPKKITFQIPRQNLLGVFESRQKPPVPDPKLAVREAVRAGGIDTIVKPEDSVCIVIDDITRPTPSQMILEVLLDELDSLNVNTGAVKIVAGIALHRRLSPEDFGKLVGEDIMRRVQVLNPDPTEASKNTVIGTTSFGTKVSISSLVAESDVKIITGYIGPHQLAGYTGGRKSILPGIASEETIVQHHGQRFDDPSSQMGSLEGNNFHLDLEEAARMSGVDLIVNVVLNTKKEMVAVVAGDLVDAFLRGVKVADEISRVTLSRTPDIVITSPGGLPKDIDLRTSQKAVPSAEMTVKEGGFIILPAMCQEGLGMSEEFRRICSKSRNAQEAMNMAKDIIMRDGWSQPRMLVYLYCRAMSKARVILVSEGISAEDARKAFLIPAPSIEEALNMAMGEIGEDAKIAVFPAPEIIPRIQ